jgi:polyisoprenoid-binding protein YceI
MGKMFRKYSLIGWLVLGGLTSATGALAQETAWRIDSQHSTARFFLASSRSSEAGVNVGVARASGVIDGSAGDSSPSDFAFTIYPADKTGLPDGSGQRAANSVDYTVIHFRSKRVVPMGQDTFRVMGDLTLTYVQQLATYDPSEAYAGPVYGPAVTDSVTQPAVFEFRRVTRAPRSTVNQAEWSASSTMNGEDFPELLNAVSSTNWPAFVANEKCTLPSNAGEGFSGPACTGTAIEVAARLDVRCEVPSVGEDSAGEVCRPTAAPMNGKTQVRRPSSGEQTQLVANEVKMQLDLQLTRVDSPASVGSGQ